MHKLNETLLHLTRGSLRRAPWSLLINTLSACLLALCPTLPALAAQVEEPLKAALELHEAGKAKEAIPLYDQVIKANPKLAEAYFNRGNAYFDLGQNDMAVKDYSEAIRLNPKDSEAFWYVLLLFIV